MDENNDKGGKGRSGGGDRGGRGPGGSRDGQGGNRSGGGGYRGNREGGERSGGGGGGYRNNREGGERSGSGGGGYRGNREGGERSGGGGGGYRGNREGGERSGGGGGGGGYRGNREGGERSGGGGGGGGYRGNRDSDDRGPRREGGRDGDGDRGGYKGNRDGGDRPQRRDDGREGKPGDRREGRGHFRQTEGRETGRRDNKKRQGPARRPVEVSVRSGQRGGGQDAQHWIFGKHAVLAALANPNRDIQRLVATEQMAEQAGIADNALLEKVARPDMDHMLSRYDASATTHGGIAAYAAVLTPPTIDTLLKPEGPAVVVLLDQVSDPHNVGAIMRTAAAFGARAVIAPERNAAPVTGSLAKSASGALESVPYLRPTNLSRTLAMLKEWGYWRIGLDGSSDKPVEEATGFERVALVLGSEGKGLRRLTGENCDLLVSIPMSGEVESLNVSNAAAIAMYRLFTR
jgi:23S rRNA (guanosine2251-2'-O)-methyltransferase